MVLASSDTRLKRYLKDCLFNTGMFSWEYSKSEYLLLLNVYYLLFNDRRGVNIDMGASFMFYT